MSKALIISNRNYRLLLSASSVSNLGDGIAMVALPWLATMLTTDPLFIAGVATAQRLPWLLFSLPVGVWTDRADRRLLMFRADLVRVALMAFTVLMIVSQTSMPPTGSGPAAILSLTVIAFLFGSAEVVRDNAAQTVLPSIVAHAELERALMMRGTDEKGGSLFSYVDLEDRIPFKHPLRKIRRVVNDALASLDAEFEALHVDFSRPSIAPERLIRASLM